MFFTISKEPCSILSEKHTIGDWIISMDSGWRSYRQDGCLIVKKGFANTNCEIRSDGHDWQIVTDGIRRFPLWRSENGDTVSNLHVTANQIHNPHNPVYVGGKLQIKQGERPRGLIANRSDIMRRKTIEERLCDNLVKQVDVLRDIDLPIIAPMSKGVDCALVRATLDYCGVTYASEKISANTLNKSHLTSHKAFWGYGQMLDESEPHIQATGYNGDSYMSRDPLHVSLYLKRWNIDITEEFDKAGNTYMRNSFDRYYRDYLAGYDYSKTAELELVDRLLNDFQIWHIDECFTWTPFADLDIMRTCLRLDPETAVDQCVNAGLSRSLIKRLNPKRLDEIQEHHNGNPPI